MSNQLDEQSRGSDAREEYFLPGLVHEGSRDLTDNQELMKFHGMTVGYNSVAQGVLDGLVSEADIYIEGFGVTESDGFAPRTRRFIGDGKNIYSIEVFDREDSFANVDVKCEGVLDPDRYSRIEEEAPLVYDDVEEDEGFEVVVQFLLNEEIPYWDKELREQTEREYGFAQSNTAAKTRQEVASERTIGYLDPYSRDWSIAGDLSRE